MTEPDPFAVFSASLPLRMAEDGTIDLRDDPRPWNGRDLKKYEVMGCWLVATKVFGDTGSYGLAAQSAHEWLSEHAW